jgi:Lysyl oxidase
MHSQTLSAVSLTATLLASVAFTGCAAAVDSDPEALGSVSSALSTTLRLGDGDRADFSSGTATNAAPIAGQPDVCSTVKCVAFKLKVDLPHHIWDKPGGVQVGIRWPDDTNILNLFVYSGDGTHAGDVQVGSSLGILAASSGGVVIANAPNGNYTVYVAFDPAGSIDSSVAFDVEATVQFDPKVKPIRPLRPDLAMRPQTHVGFDTPSFPIFGDPDPPPGETCYQSEKDEEGAHVCLRFDQTFGNIGEGATELRFAVPHDPADTSHQVFERTFFSDSASHFQDTPAGEWEFHEAHGHFHYENFAQSNLWATDKKGRRSGTAPVASGRKVSFCVEDELLDPEKWGKKGVGARNYHAPDCLFPQVSDANFDYLIQGLTPGWADLYQWYLPGQYMEVTGVPNGDYILETIVDPDNKVTESDESNNCGSVRVRLSHMGTPQRTAQLMGAGPACPK